MVIFCRRDVPLSVVAICFCCHIIPLPDWYSKIVSVCLLICLYVPSSLLIQSLRKSTQLHILNFDISSLYFRVQPDMKCIVFVNRIVTARSLSYILQHLKILSSWKCGFLVGVHSGLKSMSRKNTNIILDKFRSGEVMVLC